MKLLIVDDEPLARVGMRTIIPWHEKGFEILGEAANVNDALELARRTPPDLALVDIVMPEKNGFELIREIQKINTGCKFIIISCRSTVEFYRQAISMGVSEYIQKGTLEAEELEAVVEKVRQQIEKERLILTSPVFFAKTDFVAMSPGLSCPQSISEAICVHSAFQ